ncbi:MAG: hypothetical protein H6Q17_416 [Bacteroidetes bacterium]|nr:hypothetical protein [Bacteroidota bacterium]
MKEQIPQPAPLSRTLQGKSREANTASVNDVLQAYKKDISQRQEIEDDDELLQGKFETAQREELDDDELLQGKFETAQRDELEDDELLQGKFETTQRQEAPNNTGLPDNLKAGVEQLSGLDMSDVKVHYNSSKPASVQAYAYTQGADIHVAPGQEKHLGHEAWHVAQQKQGRVQPTTTVGGMAVNDNPGLESEADVMGGKAVQMKPEGNKSRSVANSVAQKQNAQKQNSGRQGFEFVDNRPEAVEQRKLQEMVNTKQVIQPKLYIGSSTTPESRETAKADRLNQSPEIMNRIYSLIDSKEEHKFDDWVSAILHVQDSPSYNKTGEGLEYGRRKITLDDSESNTFSSKFKDAMSFICEVEDLSSQVARLLIYTKEAICYDDSERDTTYTKTSPAGASSKDTRFSGDLGSLLAKKATICREKSAFAQVLLAELGIDSVAVYGTGSSGAHAWLEIPSAKEVDINFGRVDPTWGQAGSSLRQIHNQTFTQKMEYASGKAALVQTKYPKDGAQIMTAIKEAEQKLKTEETQLKEALTKHQSSKKSQ